MILQTMKFCRFRGEINEWSIEGKIVDGESALSFENINLIVGKNASGKSKTIDAIRDIADLLSGDLKLSRLHYAGLGTAEYELIFDDNGDVLEYQIAFKNGKIIKENLRVKDQLRLDRSNGQLWYEGTNGMLDFQTDDDVLAVSKRDKKQHPFFETLFLWGKNLSHYRFGSELGRNALLKDIQIIDEDDEVNFKDGNDVTKIFIKGQKRFTDSFTNQVIEDMNSIAYDISKIEVGPIRTYPHFSYGLNVHEGDLADITEQREMSQGMFRALSLLIQLNYSLLSNLPSCILIDDIGEGLDYDRSKHLIDLIIHKVENSSVQVIMTTNDRFVMNKIPLKYWSVIQRTPKRSIFYNYKNSKEIFDEYEYTGLNNFDFLSSNFYLTGFEPTTKETE